MNLQNIGWIQTNYRKYVGVGDLDIARLRDVIRREARLAERGIIRVSRGLLCELRADRAKVGRIFNEVAA